MRKHKLTFHMQSPILISMLPPDTVADLKCGYCADRPKTDGTPSLDYGLRKAVLVLSLVGTPCTARTFIPRLPRGCQINMSVPGLATLTLFSLLYSFREIPPSRRFGMYDLAKMYTLGTKRNYGPLEMSDEL